MFSIVRLELDNLMLWKVLSEALTLGRRGSNTVICGKRYGTQQPGAAFSIFKNAADRTAIAGVSYRCLDASVGKLYKSADGAGPTAPGKRALNVIERGLATSASVGTAGEVHAPRPAAHSHQVSTFLCIANEALVQLRERRAKGSRRVSTRVELVSEQREKLGV